MPTGHLPQPLLAATVPSWPSQLLLQQLQLLQLLQLVLPLQLQQHPLLLLLPHVQQLLLQQQQPKSLTLLTRSLTSTSRS